MAWQLREDAYDDYDMVEVPGCIWCGTHSRGVSAIWTEHGWVPWGEGADTSPRLPYVREFLRVAALRRPQTRLPELDEAVRLWVEVATDERARGSHPELWKLMVLNRHVSLREARRYLNVNPAARATDEVPDPIPPSEAYGHPHLELARQRRLLAADLERLGMSNSEPFVTTSDGTRWQASVQSWPRILVRREPGAVGGGEWFVHLNPFIPPSPREWDCVPPPRVAYVQMATYFREVDPVMQAYRADAARLTGPWLGRGEDDDELVPASLVGERINAFCSLRTRLASREPVPNEGELRARLVDRVSLARATEKAAADMRKSRDQRESFRPVLLLRATLSGFLTTVRDRAQ